MPRRRSRDQRSRCWRSASPSERSSGDHLGFAIGRRYGDSLRQTRVVRRLGVHQYDRAAAKLRRHGGLAAFLTRLVLVVRTLTPAAAGASGHSYRRFAPASLAGSALWAGVYVGGGSAAGALAPLGRRAGLIGSVAATATR
ncbi:MAG: DedA family protein [Aeromicrobium sp.]